MLFSLLDNPLESGIVAIATTLLNTGLWAYIWKRRLDRKGETTVVKEWQEYAAQLREDLDSHKEESRREIAGLTDRSRRCEDRERKLRNRVAALEHKAGIHPPNDSADDTPNIAGTDADSDGE